jgi:hypothetical protein
MAVLLNRNDLIVVSVPTLERFWFRHRFRIRIQKIFSTVFQQQNFFVQNLALSMLEAALLPRRFGSSFMICISFYVGSGSKSGSSSAEAKSCSSCGYSSTTLPDGQYFI